MPGIKKSIIKKILRRKINSWLNTIETEEVRKAICRDAIITGGAIVSLLQGFKPNDYDVYFKTNDTAEIVANHYVDEFSAVKAKLSSIAPSALNPKVLRINRKNIRGYTEERVGIYIKSAGVIGEGQDEYRYFESETDATTEDFIDSLPVGNKDLKEVFDHIKKERKQLFKPIFFSENAITLSEKMQIILRFTGNVDQIHENYDFVHTTCSYEYSTDTLKLPGEALEAILSKSLIYKGSLYPVASIFRLRKFIQRGWRITAGQLLKIMFQISEINLYNYETLREQLIGVDAAYMRELLAAIKDDKPEMIDGAYLCGVIDKIFEE
jgi:hypothetical protein